LRLVTVCDALFENYRASSDRLGLGYAVLSQVNPRLGYVKISSQGATGPEKDYGSLGSTLEQTAGLASITGYEDGNPLMTNETYPDPVVGILAVGAFMAALRRRRQTGSGSFVDLSQREVTATMLGEYLVDYALTGRIASPMGNRHALRQPGRVSLPGPGYVAGYLGWFGRRVAQVVSGHRATTARPRPAVCHRPGPSTASGRDRSAVDRLDAGARSLPGHAHSANARRCRWRRADRRRNVS
jgi:crotonobetainyl-CoA:carnitine CoA-transferase CaiB-like acyl-CoA transferase